MTNKTLSILLASFIALSYFTNLPAAAKFKLEEKSKGKNTVDPSQANLKIGQQAMKARDYDTAIDALLQSVYFARNTYNPEAYLLLGQCYKEKKQDTKAIEALLKSIEQTMGSPATARLELAEVYLRNDRHKEADQEISQAISDAMGAPPKAYFLFGQMLEKENNLDSAQTQYLQALGDQPWTYVEAWMALAYIYMRQGAWVEAAKQYSAMISREGDLRDKGLNLEEVLLNLGVAYSAKGNHQGAIDSFHKALAVNPESAKAHLYLARLFDEEKHISSAVNEYRAYIRLADGDKDLQKYKDRLVFLEQQLRTTQARPVYAPNPSSREASPEESEAPPASSGF